MQSTNLWSPKTLYVFFRVLRNVRKRPSPRIKNVLNFLLVRVSCSLNVCQRIPEPYTVRDIYLFISGIDFSAEDGAIVFGEVLGFWRNN
jgi:hypothetical protein